MTTELFREDSYLKSCNATVTSTGDRCVFVDQTVFYPLGGGQPGDNGTLRWDGGEARIVDTRYVDGGIGHIVEEGATMPGVGTAVELTLDWDRRYRLMRMHSCMHMLCAVIPAPVTGVVSATDVAAWIST